MDNITTHTVRIEVTQLGAADYFVSSFTPALMRAEATAAVLAQAQFPGSTVLGSNFIVAHPHDPALEGRLVEVEVVVAL